MKNYLGYILVIVGAIVEILSFFCGWNNYNAVTGGGLVLIIAGIVTFIVTNHKNQKAEE